MKPRTKALAVSAPRGALLFLLGLVTLSVLAELLIGSDPVAISVNGHVYILPAITATSLEHQANGLLSHDWIVWPLIHTHSNVPSEPGWRTLLEWWTYATRYSLLVTAVVALLATSAGAVGGWLAAAGPRPFDFVLRKTVELSGALPSLVLLAALRVSGAIPTGLDVVIVLVVLRSIEVAHLVRSLMLSLGDRDFLTAARSVGGNPLHILRWHLFPHLTRPLAALVVTTLASVLSVEAALSLIGLGSQHQASWAVMLIAEPSASLHGATLCALISVLATTLALSILARQLQRDRWIERHHV